jgi:GMP synthase-like glutamine amidotransferase
MRAVMVADNVDRDPGLLGEFLRGSGATLRYLDRARLPETGVTASVVILLGSNRSAHEETNAAVVANEVALIRRSLDLGVPVMGICYGAQVLARALGGSSRRGEYPECGWTEVFSSDARLCPPGYWGQMHHDVIVPAETSSVIGWSEAGPQGFIDDSLGARAIGWQFHPELTVTTLERWLSGHYSGSESADPQSTIASAARHSRDSVPRAGALFRAAFEYLNVSNQELG